MMLLLSESKRCIGEIRAKNKLCCGKIIWVFSKGWGGISFVGTSTCMNDDA